MVQVRSRRFGVVVFALVACCMQGGGTGERTSALLGLPSGFTQTVVASGLVEPTAMAFLPNGTLLAESRRGMVRVIKNGMMLASPAIDLTSKVCPERERGLLGIAVDPEFAANKQVYLYYTAKHANCDLNDETGALNRVSRFTYDTASDKMSGEVVLVDNILSWNGWHNAGDLQFGQDGLLYFGVGDSGAAFGTNNTGWRNDNARYKSLLNGKVLRVQKHTGAPAPGNPFLGPGSRRCGDPGQPAQFIRDNSQPCQETFAWGFRNPFRIPFKPGTNTFFVNDVGQDIGSDWEEINEGQKGADYGWNRNQGRTSEAGTTNPIYAYPIGEQVGGAACRCITGGAFVPPNAWPDAYQDAYIFGDYTCGAIFLLTQQGGSWVRRTFATGAGGSSIVHMVFGPNPKGGQSLYYSSFTASQIVRIDAPPTTPGNTPPTAVATATPSYGKAPLAVSFDASMSYDQDPGDGIAKYTWSFGDGSPAESSTIPTVMHTYVTTGKHTAKLTVEDRGTPRKQGTTTLEIQVGNTPPTVTIVSPTADASFAVGETGTLSATATDAEDGTLPEASLAWTVKKHHDDHTHPFFSGNGNQLALLFDGPETLSAADGSYFEIHLVATDSQGLATEVEQDIQPNKVPITFTTSPAGLQLRVEATDVVGPRTLTSWQGWELHVEAPTQMLGGETYVFDKWSDGGDAMRTIVTPASATTYEAVFKVSGDHGPPSNEGCACALAAAAHDGRREVAAAALFALLGLLAWRRWRREHRERKRS
jgi:MYXO-CTERM domain-containing protein